MKYGQLLLLMVILALFACESQKVVKEVPIEISMTEDLFVSQGLEYVNRGNNSLLSNLINKHSPEYPDGAEKIIKAVYEKNKNNTEALLKEKDCFGALFYHRNLSAFKGTDELEERVFFKDLCQSLEEQSFEATAKYLRTMHGLPVVYKDAYIPVERLNNFIDLLAEVYVVRSFKTSLGLERKDYPYFSGSGFLIDPRHVVTAYHVIEQVFDKDTQSYEIVLRIQDKMIGKVKLLSWDSLTDIALLSLPEELPMPYAFYRMLGDSDKLKQGFEVYCLGNHVGFTSTLTKGIVSSVKRKAPEVGSWIQVDANIAPGASGGLLIGRDDLVYGMLVARIGFEDINFAVPSNIILGILDKLGQGKVIKRPWLGFILSSSLDNPGVIIIDDIFPSSPFKFLGIEPGDRLIEINHKLSSSIEEAQECINELEAGNWVHVAIEKPNGTKKDYWTILARRPDYAIYNATRNFNKLSSLYPHFGFKVSPDVMLSREIFIKGETISLNFYKVIDVAPYSFLDSRGVEAGDAVGFIYDYFEDKTRYIQILHLPYGKVFEKPEQFLDCIYTMKKDKYDENIL
ncbi:MAG: serine protease [Spirochaetales bacterium]|nr:serine protease [Spirochaetales bacterium]